MAYTRWMNNTNMDEQINTMIEDKLKNLKCATNSDITNTVTSESKSQSEEKVASLFPYELKISDEGRYGYKYKNEFKPFPLMLDKVAWLSFQTALTSGKLSNYSLIQSSYNNFDFEIINAGVKAKKKMWLKCYPFAQASATAEITYSFEHGVLIDPVNSGFFKSYSAEQSKYAPSFLYLNCSRETGFFLDVGDYVVFRSELYKSSASKVYDILSVWFTYTLL